MKKSKILIIIIVVVAVVAVGYFAYTQDNTLKTQEFLKTSHDLKDDASAYFDQAVDYENAGDYSAAIVMYQKSADEVKRAVNNYNPALNHASGVYREYMDNDILLLEKTAQLIEYKIYVNQYRNNSLNPGQEKVDPSVLAPYIDNLTRDVATYKDKENQIVSNSPGEFRFLNQ